MADRRFRPSLWATLVTVPAVLVMLGLGTWQVQRMGWKAELIARVEERARAAPVALPAEIADPDSWDFRPVTVTGRFRHDKAMLLLARPREGRAGYEVVTPLLREAGPPVLVNRGFVPLERRDPRSWGGAGPEGAVTVAGIARLPQPAGLFQPDNRKGAETWVRLDIPAMAAASGLPAAAPVVVEALPTGGLPAGIETRVALPNNHLQYAITWYSLAATLVIVYLLSQRRRTP